jgi:hypothetical protein
LLFDTEYVGKNVLCTFELNSPPLTIGQVLRKHFYEPPLAYDVVREMAKSWTSRRKAREADRDEQLEAIEETGLRLGI